MNNKDKYYTEFYNKLSDMPYITKVEIDEKFFYNLLHDIILAQSGLYWSTYYYNPINKLTLYFNDRAVEVTKQET
jgi:hypothetical protein